MPKPKNASAPTYHHMIVPTTYGVARPRTSLDVYALRACFRPTTPTASINRERHFPVCLVPELSSCTAPNHAATALASRQRSARADSGAALQPTNATVPAHPSIRTKQRHRSHHRHLLSHPTHPTTTTTPGVNQSTGALLPSATAPTKSPSCAGAHFGAISRRTNALASSRRSETTALVSAEMLAFLVLVVDLALLAALLETEVRAVSTNSALTTQLGQPLTRATPSTAPFQTKTTPKARKMPKMITHSKEEYPSMKTSLIQVSQVRDGFLQVFSICRIHRRSTIIVNYNNKNSNNQIHSSRS
mmetsp:Transcript_11087/g.20357  ORF Transcript_11087/g.20357 Transcript_11087/m.20357 type:complete len:303 (-) Transcript_11087:1011-1919(-)